MSVNVFDIEDIRKEIFSYLPKKCYSCNHKMNGISKIKYKKYLDYSWRRSENEYMKNYCNWCYYYVFEYD